MIFQELQVKTPVYHEWTKDHDEHVKELNGLVSLSEAIRKEPTEKRLEKGAELYDTLSLFLSRDLTHMAWEQDIGLKTLWKHYTDEEIMKRAQEALKKYDTLEAMQFMCPYMIQAGALEDNIEFFTIMKEMPGTKEEKTAILEGLGKLLPPARWEKLKQMKVV